MARARRSWVPPALTLIVPGVCAIAFVLGSRSKVTHASSGDPSIARAPEEPAAGGPAPSAAPVALPPPSPTPVSQASAQKIQERIRVAYETQASDVRTERDLDRYLDGLEAKARAQGSVTALEVQPGVMAIRKAPYTEDGERRMQRVMEFSDRMAKLSAQLRGASDTPVSLPSLDAIKNASGADRTQLIDKYLEGSRRLEPEQRQEANQQLNDLIQNN